MLITMWSVGALKMNDLLANTPLTDDELLAAYKLALEHEPDQMLKALKAVVPLAMELIDQAINFSTGDFPDFYFCSVCGAELHSEPSNALYRQYELGKPFPHEHDCIVKLAEEFVK